MKLVIAVRSTEEVSRMISKLEWARLSCGSDHVTAPSGTQYLIVAPTARQAAATEELLLKAGYAIVARG